MSVKLDDVCGLYDFIELKVGWTSTGLGKNDNC